MSTDDYRSFTLQVSPISKRTGKYRVKVIPPAPSGEIGFDEYGEAAYDPATFNVESNGGAVSLLELMKLRTVTGAQLYRLGAILAAMLLPGKVKRRLLDSMRVVESRKQRLRLRLIIEAPELALLPWEYLYLRPDGAASDDPLFFLALRPDISIVRHELIDEPEPYIERRASYRLVAASATPSDQPALKSGEDHRIISGMTQSANGAYVVEPNWVEDATLKSLRDALSEPADIFHFSGHGRFDRGKGQIILKNEKDSTSYFYGAAKLAQLLRGARVRLAVLNACESGARSGENLWGGVAPALVRAGLAAVVASQYKLQDVNAVPLAEELYRGVLGGGRIDEAVSAARIAIFQQSGLENRDWGSPVLYMRVEDGIIFPGGGEWPVRLVPRVAPTPLQVSLIGRERELATAEETLLQRSKCYFYGTYGVGKTSLAVELFGRAVKARPLVDGYIWGQVTAMNAEQALEWLGAQFTAQGVARSVGVTAKVNALRDLLSQRKDLLIGLDEVDPKAAKAILEASGDCAVILNGASLFNSDGLAREIPLTPLSPEDAVRLFVTLANLEPSSLRPEEVEVVRQICVKMQCLPLAVKLAAIKCAEGESVATLWERVRSAPGTLVKADSIYGTLYEDLKGSPEALRMLARLASFPTREASLAALRDGEPGASFFQTKDKLTALQLINPSGPDRLSLHPVLGLGIEKAEPAAIEAEREHAARWLRDYAHAMRNDYDALERERANLLGLCDRLAEVGRWDDLVTTLRDIFHFLRVRGLWEELFRRLDKVIESVDKLSTDHLRGWAYLHRGIIHMLRTSYEKSVSDFDTADVLFAASGDKPYRGKVMYRRATIDLVQGELNKAYMGLKRALKFLGKEGHCLDRAAAHERLASLHATAGDLQEAQTHYAEALSLGDDEQKARVHIALGDLSRQAGEYPAAQQHFETALGLARRLGHVLHNAFIEQELGYVHYYQGHWDEAVRHFESARSSFEQLKYRPGLAQARHALGNVALAHGDLDLAEKSYAEALELNNTLGHVANAAYNTYQLGVVAHRRGQTDEARAKYADAGSVALRIHDKALEAATHLQLSTLELADGKPDAARYEAYQALSMALIVKDQLTEASALYNLSLLDAQKGFTEEAFRKLADAHKKLDAWDAVDAAKIKQLLSVMTEASAGPQGGGGGTGGTGFGSVGWIDRIVPGRVMEFNVADIGRGRAKLLQATERVMKGGNLAGTTFGSPRM